MGGTQGAYSQTVKFQRKKGVSVDKKMKGKAGKIILFDAHCKLPRGVRLSRGGATIEDRWGNMVFFDNEDSLEKFLGKSLKRADIHFFFDEKNNLLMLSEEDFKAIKKNGKLLFKK